MLKQTLLIILSFISYASLATVSNVNYDSLLTIVEKSTDREDFKRLDSILDLSTAEYGTPIEKRIILTASQRTKELDFEFLYGKFIFRESIINTIHGDIGEAMQQAMEALRIFSKYRSLDAARCFNTMGSMVAGLGDTKSALNYLNRAVEIADYFKDDPRSVYLQSDNHLVLGYIYILAEEYDSSLYHLYESNALSASIDYNSSLNYVQLNLADVYRHQGKFDQAFVAARESIRISEEHQFDNLKCIGFQRMGEAHYAMEAIDSALHYYQIAEDLCFQQNLNRRLIKIYKVIISIYLDRKDYEVASSYQTKLIDLTGKIEANENEARFEIAQTKFEVVEKISQINSLAIQRDLETQQNNLLTIAIIITIAAFILLVVVVLLIFNRLRLNRRIENERYEKELSIYQMTAMKTQMNPHFTFNALTSIQDLILKEKTDESYSYISKFANLMRKTLNHSNKEFIDIHDEFEAIQLYLELEALRFHGDLSIDFETNNIENVKIPPLLIQPFIENAIKHGLFHKKGNKHLRINFKMKDDDLICTISDNGIGRKASEKIQERRSKLHESFAVKSIESRFEILRKIYKKTIGVTYIDLETDSTPQGTTVIISLPFKQIH